MTQSPRISWALSSSLQDCVFLNVTTGQAVCLSQGMAVRLAVEGSEVSVFMT